MRILFDPGGRSRAFPASLFVGAPLSVIYIRFAPKEDYHKLLASHGAASRELYKPIDRTVSDRRTGEAGRARHDAELQGRIS